MKKQPDIIIFTGFLGSGKTSLLLKTIEILNKRKKLCALIVNEAGDVGIDNRLIRKKGYEVYDLFGGCVCCTLRVTLQATVQHLCDAKANLDYILFEPSGIADPQSIVKALTDFGYRKERIHCIFVADPLRVDLYDIRLRHFFDNCVATAKKIIVNKIDVAPQENINAMRKLLDGCIAPVYYYNLLEEASWIDTMIEEEGKNVSE